MGLFFEPLDVLFFRDSKPFGAGEASFASTTFPLPSVFFGAIRTKLLSEHCGDFNLYRDNCQRCSKKDNCEIRVVIGTPEDSGELRVKGPFIAKESGAFEYFPMPKDVIEFKDKNGGLDLLRPIRSSPVTTDLKLPIALPWIRNTRAFENAEGFIAKDELMKYLKGEIPLKTDVEELYEKEYRVGIKMSKKTGSSETGFLYSIEFLRLKEEVGFTFYFEGLDKINFKPGIITLGGEMRVAKVSSIEDVEWDFEEVKKEIESSKLFKLYLATPAIFDRGWLPSFINRNLEGEKSGLKFKLISACVDRAVPISGFDIAERKPKPILRAVPAGSVYYFELLEGDIEKLFNTFDFQSISDKNLEAGFGITFVGGVDYV